jgi:predicted DNA-binding protein with PD1-like motif
MRYTEGRVGRVFYVRVDHGEDLLGTLQTFVAEKGIRSGIIQFLGAVKEGRIVTGPRDPVLPPEPTHESYEGGWELVGLATITPGPDRPHLHYHASAGRGREALTGCLREKAVTYIIVEAVVMEILGTRIERRFDPMTGLDLPLPGPQGGAMRDQ